MVESREDGEGRGRGGSEVVEVEREYNKQRRVSEAFRMTKQLRLPTQSTSLLEPLPASQAGQARETRNRSPH